jgi:hypothetical protein
MQDRPLMFRVSAQRLAALAVAVGATAVAGLVGGLSAEFQPVALPIAFGVALAVAIDPRLWLVHLLVVGIGLIMLDTAFYDGGTFDGFDVMGIKTLMSLMAPALIGAAAVRFLYRSAI